MRSVTAFILLSFVLPTCAKETSSSPTSEIQNAKLDNPFFDRTLPTRPIQNADLDNTLLGKPGQLNPVQSRWTPQAKPFLSASYTMPVVKRPVMANYESTKMHTLEKQPGAKKKIRCGRGHSGKRGGSCGRGIKGQKSRGHGNGKGPGFEGGQTPLWRRIPKLKGIGSGMSAPKELYYGLNLGDIQSYIDGGRIDADQPITTRTLRDKKLVARKYYGVKLLGRGDLKSKVNLEFEATSAAGLVKLENSGSNIKIIPQEEVGSRIR